MIIQTSVPLEVCEKLKSGIEVKAITDYDGGASKKAYQVLSERANMKNFFFGMVVNSKQDKENLDYLCSLSNENNKVLLTMDIPENELFIHDYYNFTDLIYIAEDYDGVGVTEEEIQRSADFLTYKEKGNRELQVVYERILPGWILEN